MARLEEITVDASIKGVLPEGLVSVVAVQWIGTVAINLTYRDAAGQLGSELLYRDREPTLEVTVDGRPWSFDGDGAMFRLVSEAHRIRLAYLFDPLLAVHTSLVEPLPHQITAVYGEMLPRQPLRFMLADDPGAGKTIMAGLFIKELMVRGDLQRCLIVCPGNLAEQWQDELDRRFHLPFEIMTNDALEAARTGNWFLENPLAICRLDKLSRDIVSQAARPASDQPDGAENADRGKLIAKLEQTDWDLVVCDEAHKLSATYFGNEVKYTKRYRLGQLLSTVTRHFLLLTATPHNGKEADFQLFMALVDGDRFEGKFRDGVHAADASDLMRRLVKEHLLKFDGTPLFPERIAYTVGYRLSDAEADLYRDVTDYVREEFNRAEALASGGQKGTVGFALTILQRRLASSPEAIYQSLRRRRERLQKRLREEQLLRRGGPGLRVVSTADLVAMAASSSSPARIDLLSDLPSYGQDELDDLDDAPDAELEEAEERVVDQASAAQTIAELQTEIGMLERLERSALKVRQSGSDKKWDELSRLLQNNSEMFDAHGHRRKLVIFTEHRDTLNYLAERSRALLGKPEALVTIHGGMGREERKKAQEAFTHDKEVEILVATDAAGEGINLQRAHLMVNYDLPWNPNRLEQRFGRIHRIGQTEVCHLWNLVARETREGEVYLRLLEKLAEEREALGGQVFDVLGELKFEDRPLRQLLLEAVRYGDQPEVRAKLYQVVEQALDRDHLRNLIEGRALTHDAMDVTRVREIREDMERADARKLQPHFIAEFFIEAFKLLGGTIHEREPKRYEVKHVPAPIRHRDRQIGLGEPVLERYERIAFDKALISVPGKPLAAFICPGHPLLDATIDLVIERYRDLLKRGAVLVDERDPGDQPRALVYLEHSIQDARPSTPARRVGDGPGNRRVVSRRLQFVEVSSTGFQPVPSDPGSSIGFQPVPPASTEPHRQDAYATRGQSDTTERHRQDAYATPGASSSGDGHRQDAYATRGVTMPLLLHAFDPEADVDVFEANLPHWRQEGATYFVTFRLGDSLPQQTLAELRQERQTWLRSQSAIAASARARAYQAWLSEKLEAYLGAGYGACWLRQSAVADEVERSLRHFDSERYVLGDFVIMPNHVHVLVRPLPGWDLSDILHSWKSFTANKINRLVGREGKLWQRESYDHIVRDEDENYAFQVYIRENPIKAALPTGDYRLHSLSNTPSSSIGFQPVPAKGGDGHRQDAYATAGSSIGFQPVPPGSTEAHRQDAYATPVPPDSTEAHRQDAYATDAFATRSSGPAPYLDYRPLTDEERGALALVPMPRWLRTDLEAKVLEHAAIHLVPGHLDEVRRRKEEVVDKTAAAVKERLTAEINYWDHRAEQLKEQELAGRINARLNSGLARQRADELTSRLQKRLSELEQERKLSPLPPVVLGGAMVVPLGLLRSLQNRPAPPTFAADTEHCERLAMQAVMAAERRLGYEPRDVSREKLGYDVESRVPAAGRLRFIEVKGRIAGARTVTVTKNEILTALNKPDDFILAIVSVDGDATEVCYIRRPFQNEPDFTVTSVNFDLDKLLARAEAPA